MTTSCHQADEQDIGILPLLEKLHGQLLEMLQQGELILLMIMSMVKDLWRS